jgi:hypothetical protein
MNMKNQQQKKLKKKKPKFERTHHIPTRATIGIIGAGLGTLALAQLLGGRLLQRATGVAGPRALGRQ